MREYDLINERELNSLIKKIATLKKLLYILDSCG